jgi:hypothetical protein
VSRHLVNRAFPALAGLAIVVAGLTGMARASAPRPAEVNARLGPITVTASALRPGSPGTGQRGTLTAAMRVSTTGPRPDQLDAAIAADGAPVGVYHQVISLADMPADVASCGGAVPPGGVVQRWMHYGPLTVPGKSGADAILTVQRAAPPADGTLAVTLYFATAGSVVLRLPVSG